MSQINVNAPQPVETNAAPSGDRTAAAGINLLTVVIVLAVLAAIAWYLFTGPLHSMTAGGGTTNVTVNPAPATVNVNPPAQPQAPAPANGNSTGGASTGSAGAGNTGANPAPAKP